MTARAPRVTMPGIAVEGRDGVAALVAILRASGLFEQKSVRHVGLHCQGKVLARLRAAARGFRQVIARILGRSSLLIALTDGWAAFVGGCAAGVRAAVPNVAPLPRDTPVPARVLDDANLRARLGERARYTVAQHYSTEAICGRLAAIYNDLAGA
jgi:hypothetical protein